MWLLKVQNGQTPGLACTRVFEAWFYFTVYMFVILFIYNESPTKVHSEIKETKDM